jgi:hypothetical protein
MKTRLVVVALVLASLVGGSGRAAAADFTVTAPTMSAYVINAQANPGLTLTRGRTYTFALSASGHPFWLKTAPETGTSSSYDTGVTNNGLSTGTLTFVVPASAPSLLYYQCQFHEPMTGVITIVSPPAVPATTTFSRGVLGAALALMGLVVLTRRRLRERSEASGNRTLSRDGRAVGGGLRLAWRLLLCRA